MGADVKKRGQVGLRLALTMAVIMGLTGCGWFAGSGGERNADRDQSQTKSPIVRYEGEPSKVIPFVYTGGRELSLTFNGMADDVTMRRLLDELDKYGVKATFFLPGMRVAEESELAKEIARRGHEIENNTLSRLDMTKLAYDKIYREIHLANKVIERETGIKPRYVRTKSGDYNDDVRLAAAQEGMKAVVVYSLFLHNWQRENDWEKYLYIRKHITRGGILTIDTEEFDAAIEAIPMFAQAAREVGYKFVSLDELVSHGRERKPLEQLPGYDAVRVNLNYENAKYNLIYDQRTDKKEIALTFDDWGTDYTVTKIMDILQRYKIKATFFVRANGVEHNPNLARAIIEEGHDVANHTYAHQVVSTLTPEELQEDLVKAYHIIMEAIQQQPTMLFRPPTGEINDNSAKIISGVGYPNIAMYDVNTLDWDKKKSAEDIVNTIMKDTQNGSIILLHMLDDIHTIEALPIAIEKLQAQGYTFVKMAELIGLNS